MCFAKRLCCVRRSNRSGILCTKVRHVVICCLALLLRCIAAAAGRADVDVCWHSCCVSSELKHHKETACVRMCMYCCHIGNVTASEGSVSSCICLQQCVCDRDVLCTVHAHMCMQKRTLCWNVTEPCNNKPLHFSTCYSNCCVTQTIEGTKAEGTETETERETERRQNMEVLRGMVVVEEARGKKQNDMQTNISRQNENSNERGKEEDEVLPFRGRGFLRVHGHERCLLAALWPRDHRRRRNGTESSFFPHTSCFFALLYHPRLFVWVKERRGLLPPLLLLLHVFFLLLLFLLFLPLCLMSSHSKEKKGWGTRLHRGR